VVQNSGDSVGLDSGADESRTVKGGRRRRLLTLDELLLGIGVLGFTVGFAEHGAQHREVRGVVEEGAEGDGGGLDGREVFESVPSAGGG
jgi:hypothetical protein